LSGLTQSYACCQWAFCEKSMPYLISSKFSKLYLFQLREIASFPVNLARVEKLNDLKIKVAKN
jgi:hypothetical protein